MGTARVADGATRARKRYDLERHLYKVGHRFPTGDRARPGQPLSAWDCVCNLLSWLDGRDDPQGRLYGVTIEEVEREAWWDGKPGALWQALLDTEWIDHDGTGYRWHDYYAMNGRTIYERLKKRGKRSATPADAPRGGTAGGTRRGTEGGTEKGTRGGGIGLGSGSGGSEEELPPVSSPSVAPAREPQTGGSLEPSAPPEGAGPAQKVQSEALAALLEVEPNLATVPPRDDGRTRTLHTGRHYLGLLRIRAPALHARLTASRMSNPKPGRLLREVAPEAFRALLVAIERGLPGAQDRPAYLRSALADAWCGALGTLADQAQARRAAGGAREEPKERGYAPTAAAIGISTTRPTGVRCAPSGASRLS